MSSSRPQHSAHKDTWAQTTNGRLFVRTWSPAKAWSGTPIILFHDSLGCVELWRGFPAVLSERTCRTVIAYDRLGFGKSDSHPGKLGTDFISKEAETNFAAVQRHFGIERFILFGHSVGGGMAIHCGARFDDVCAAIITESAQAFVEDRTIEGIEVARELFKEDGQVERLKKYHGVKAKWVLDAWINSWLSPEFASWSLAPVLPRLRCPLFAIHGIDDEYGSARHPELIGQLAGGPARIEIMAETRHIPHQENERVVVDKIADFLKSIE